MLLVYACFLIDLKSVSQPSLKCLAVAVKTNTCLQGTEINSQWVLRVLASQGCAGSIPVWFMTFPPSRSSCWN